MSEHALTPLESPKKYPIPFQSQGGIERGMLKDIIKEVQLPAMEDPWGKDIPGAVLFVVGDSHIPRAEPKDETTLLLQPYKTISRLDPRNPKRYAEDRQTRFANTWFSEVAAIKEQIEASPEIRKGNHIPIVVHVGDAGADAELKGDMQNAFWTIGTGLSSLKDEDPRVKIALLPGDHEFDRQRHGDRVYREEMKLLGERPAFFQRVGATHLLIGVTTSLTDDSEDKQFLQWKKSQESLVKKATATALLEGRKIIFLGHKEELIHQIAEENNIPPELIEAVYAGHKHRGGVKEDPTTTRGTVGAPTFGAIGLEVNITPSFIRSVVNNEGVKTESIKFDPEKIAGLM